MDIRLEILRVNGTWTLTQSGPEVRTFATQSGAVTAGVAAAFRHNQREGGRATVHLWEGDRERLIFDTADEPTAT